jgi:Ca2+-binding RTX toxin-like protein
MLAVGPRRIPVLAGAFAVVVGVGVVVPVVHGRGRASSGRDKLAARLMRLDPGARLGGNTQVATAAGARLAGVPGRGNFMIALGPRERIVGGAGHDELGALAATGARISGGGGDDLIHGGGRNQLLVGGPGRDFIVGGANNDRILGGRGDDRLVGGGGADRLDGGPGNDRLIDKGGATVVVTGSGTNSVDVADGEVNDRVLCSPGSTNHISADRGDRIDSSCRNRASSVRYRPPASRRPAATAQQQPVSGDGSHDSPYVAACDDESQDPCVISAFAARSLSGLWANEFVPAYKCPTSHPYLYAHNYAPFGTSLIGGVEVVGLGPIGVSITGFMSIDLLHEFRVTGTDTGTFNSSATNWTTGTNSYQVKLHCTETVSLGYGGPR